MGKMLVCVYETYLSVTIGDFTIYLSHHVLSCQTTTISTLIQSNHSFLSDKSIPSLHHSLPHSSLHLPYQKNNVSALALFFFFFFFFLDQQNRPMIHLGISIPDGPGSHHQPCQIVSQRSQISGTSPLHDSPAVRLPCPLLLPWRTWREEGTRGTAHFFPELGDGRSPIGTRTSERDWGV